MLNQIKTGETFTYKYGHKEYEAGAFFAEKVVRRGGMIYIKARAEMGWELKIKVPA